VSAHPRSFVGLGDRRRRVEGEGEGKGSVGMRYVELLASYLPAVVVEELVRQQEDGEAAVVPQRAMFEAVCLFADVSGFTSLSESMTFRYGQHVGAEHLAKHLNSYFSQLVKIINSEGGDVFKFAGDAMIVLWPPGKDGEALKDRTRRAAQCAARIQALGKSLRFDDVSLSIKIGIGVGKLSILNLGGVRGRTEYVAVGEPMTQAFEAEGEAAAGDVILSNESWQLAGKYFQATKFSAGRSSKRGKLTLYRLKLESQQSTGRAKGRQHALGLLDSFSTELEAKIRKLIPSAALQSIDPEHPEFETYSSELRRVSVMFITFGINDFVIKSAATENREMKLLNDALQVVQTAVYKYEGALNKFLIDDKGAIVVVIFGLPPFSHENDPKRAVSCSLRAVEDLQTQLHLMPSVGITTGTAFCGVLGGQMRKEYSVLGDIVNLSARLMQAAQTETEEDEVPVFCDLTTFQATSRDIPFRVLGKIEVKGKKEPIPTFQPTASKGDTEARPSGAGFQEVHGPGASFHMLGPVFPRPGLSAQTAAGPQRFTQLELVATNRLPNLAENAVQRTENLRMYFRPAALEKQLKKSRGKGASSSPRKQSHMSRRLTEVFAAKGKGNKARSEKPGLPRQISTVSQDSSTIGDSGDFDFDMKSLAPESESRKASSAGRSSGTGQLTRRESFIFYNEEAPAHLGTDDVKTEAEYEEICRQAAVGVPDLRQIGKVARAKNMDSKAVLEIAIKKAKDVGMARQGIRPEDVSLLVQGTEISLDLDLWASNRERSLAHRRGSVEKDHAPIPLPFKYLEAVVNEALSLGEIRHKDDLSSIRLKAAVRGKAASFNASEPGTNITAPLYTDTSGNGGTALKIVVVPRDDLHTIQSPGSTAMQALMARKIELVEFTKGSVVVLSGDPGSGKTHLLKRFGFGFLPNTVPVLWSSEEWEHTASQYEQLFDVADDKETQRKFRNSGRNFHVWFNIISQWIFHEATAIKKKTLHKDPTKFRTELVKSALSSDMIPYASLLNEDLGTNFMAPAGAAADALNAMSEEAHSAEIESLIAGMICTIIENVVNKFKGIVILVDDSLRLDEQSWKVAVRLAQMVNADKMPLMLVFASRPFEGLIDRSMGMHPRLVEPRKRVALSVYRLLARQECVDYIHLGPLSTHLALEIFRKAVGHNVQTVSPELWRVCESRCFNNPLLIKEFAFELRQARRPKLIKYTPILARGAKKTTKGFDPNFRYIATLRVQVQQLDEPAWVFHAAHKAAVSKQTAYLATRGLLDASGMIGNSTVDGTDAGGRDFNGDKLKFSVDFFPPAEVPPPFTASGVLGARMDRLSPFEQMVLKIACVVGHIFSLRLIQDVYPRNSLGAEATAAMVKIACEELADQHGILHKVRASAYNDEYVYRFADVLLVSAIRNRMLQRHKLSLAANLTRSRSQYKAALELQQLQTEDRDPQKPKTMSLLMMSNLKTEGNSRSRIEKEGPLVMRKNQQANKIFSDWKDRYVVLTAETVLIFRKRDPRRMTERDAHIVIYLNDALVYMQEDPSIKTHPVTFVIESNEWARRGDFSYSIKDFTFAGSTEEETRRWFSRVSMVLNKNKLGALLPSNMNSISMVKKGELLPIRKRTERDLSSMLHPNESGIIITLKEAKSDVGSSKPSLTASKSVGTIDRRVAKERGSMNGLPEIYASVFILLPEAVRLVRKQTMLTSPTNAHLLKFEETFLFLLTPELMAAANGKDVDEKSATLEIVLWRQRNNALGFDRMLGVSTIPVQDLLDRAMRNELTFGDELDITEPYTEWLPGGGSTLEVKAKLALSDRDREAVQILQKEADQRASNSSVMKQEATTEAVDVGEDVYRQNSDLNARDEPALRGSSIRLVAGSFTMDTGSSVSIVRSFETVDVEDNVYGGMKEVLPRSRKLTRGASNRTMESSVFGGSSVGISDLDMGETRGAALGQSPLDTTMSHIDFLSQNAEDEDEKEELALLKQLLLTRSFTDLVKDTNLDENARAWLGTEFTRETPYRKRADSSDFAVAAQQAAKSGNKGSKVQKSAKTPRNIMRKQGSFRVALEKDAERIEDEKANERATETETQVNVYIHACRRELSNEDAMGQRHGPFPLTYYINRLAKGSMEPQTLVRIHSRKDGVTHIEDYDDEVMLEDYMKELKIEGFKAAELARRYYEEYSESADRDGEPGRGSLIGAMGMSSAMLINKTTAGKVAAAAAAAARVKAKGKAKKKAKKKKTETWVAITSKFEKFIEKANMQESRALDVSDWYFNLQLVPLEERMPMVVHMMRSLDFDTKFKIPINCMTAFVGQVQVLMTAHKNPYHNFDHACDVAQATYVFLARMGALRFLDDTEAFGVLVASLCHDLDHPGLNNAFQVKANTELAVQYEGLSVLESHHCALTFDLLRDDRCNIGCEMEPASFERLREVIVETILATDMTIHFDLTGDLRNCIVRHRDNVEDEAVNDGLDPADQILIAKSILHCSDISNPARVWTQAKRWQDLICEEFYLQGDKEKKNGWEISPNMDRETTRQEELGLNFIDFIVAPLFFALANLLPDAAQPCLELAANREHWMEILKSELGKRSHWTETSREEAFQNWEKRAETFENSLKAAGFHRRPDGVLIHHSHFDGDAEGDGDESAIAEGDTPKLSVSVYTSSSSARATSPPPSPRSAA